MAFYIFDTKKLPSYPDESKENKEISFNMSESFFQIPASLEDEPKSKGEGLTETAEVADTPALSQVFYVPETQYTPIENEKNIMINITADQSILLPSISSVLEASARSAQNHRRKSTGPPGLIPKKASFAIDRLEMPSQNPNSPLLKASESAMNLTEDSLLLALNSSIILCDEKPVNMPVNTNVLDKPKFSLDFLNTPPPPQQQQAKEGSFIENERIPTQVLIQNLGGEDETQLNMNHEISLLSIDDSNMKNDMKFDPLDLLPNTPSAPEGHDAIYFPDSFDETNNPFLGTNPNDHKKFILDPIDENTESLQNVPDVQDVQKVQSALSDDLSDNDTDEQEQDDQTSSVVTSSFQARLLSTSPDLNFTDFGTKRMALSARKTCPSKPAPLSIKPSLSKSTSNEIVVPEPIKKSLGARMKRNTQLINNVSSTPSKQQQQADIHDESFMNYMLKTENKRLSMIIAEPRKTPIAGIKTSSSLASVTGTPTKIIKTPSRTIVNNLVKEVHLASYYTDLALSSPCPPQKHESAMDSPITTNSLASHDSASNLYFKENQWVFFKNASTYLVGAIVSKTSKTRDTWRIKQSNGTEFTVSSFEMCPVAFLRPFDEFYLKQRKSGSSNVQTSGPFKFKRFNPSNNLMIEVQNQQPEDSLKLTRIAIEKETFTRIRDRFDRGSLEDSQIRDQIMNLSNNNNNLNDSTASAVAAVNSKRKKRLINVSDTSVSQTPSKRSRQQQIFLGMKFLITVGDNKEDVALKEKYSKLIESHGGELLTNLSTDHEVPVLKTFLLSNKFKRTQKFITALIRGVPRVHFNWIEACCSQCCFLDPFSFSNFLLEPVLECKPCGLLFKGKKFFFSGTPKFKNSWVGVIRLLGGTVSNTPAANTIVMTEDACNAGGVKGPVEKIVNVDWLIACITEKKFK